MNLELSTLYQISIVNNLEEIITSFKKTYLQEVPIYSAVKVNGKKLYEYARNNEEVEFTEYNITNSPEKIKEFEIMSTPVTILMDEDEEIARINGFSPDDLLALAEQI